MLILPECRTLQLTTDVVLLIGGAIPGNPNCSPMFARSTTEAEFIVGESYHPVHGLPPVHFGGTYDTSGTRYG